jgi:hypothetical protein
MKAFFVLITAAAFAGWLVGTAISGTLLVYTSDVSVPAGGVEAVSPPPAFNPADVPGCLPGQVIMRGTNGDYCQ